MYFNVLYSSLCPACALSLAHHTPALCWSIILLPAFTRDAKLRGSSLSRGPCARLLLFLELLFVKLLARLIAELLAKLLLVKLLFVRLLFLLKLLFDRLLARLIDEQLAKLLAIVLARLQLLFLGLCFAARYSV